jgi:hypothetical protein
MHINLECFFLHGFKREDGPRGPKHVAEWTLEFSHVTVKWIIYIIENCVIDDVESVTAMRDWRSLQHRCWRFQIFWDFTPCRLVCDSRRYGFFTLKMALRPSVTWVFAGGHGAKSQESWICFVIKSEGLSYGFFPGSNLVLAERESHGFWLGQIRRSIREWSVVIMLVITMLLWLCDVHFVGERVTTFDEGHVNAWVHASDHGVWSWFTSLLEAQWRQCTTCSNIDPPNTSDHFMYH